MDRILERCPELPLLRYVAEQVEQYMAVESAVEAKYMAAKSEDEEGPIEENANSRERGAEWPLKKCLIDLLHQT